MRYVVRSALLALALNFSGLFSDARAATYDISLGLPGQLYGGAELVTNVGVFGINSGYLSAFYSFNPGDVINFGGVILYEALGGDQYGDTFIYNTLLQVYYTPLSSNFISDPQSGFGCGPNSNPSCQSSLLTEVNTFNNNATPLQLTFTIPEGDTGIQVAFSEPNDYIPPVPEPSTWAMLLIGFAGIGFAACRRRIAALSGQTR